jgi:hypothetical protein
MSDATQPEPLPNTATAAPEPAPEVAPIDPVLAAKLVKIADDAKAAAKDRRVAMIDWLMSLDAAVREGKMLVSRANEMYLWQQTGFIIEKGKVFGKYGNNPYQPIGTDDGEGYYPTEGAALLWSHDYAIASVDQIPGPFKITRKPVVVDISEATQTALSDKERDMMVEALKELQGSLQVSKSLGEGAKAEDKAKAAQDLLDKVKWYSFQIKRLDATLSALAEKNPDFKRDLTGLDPASLAEACTEFLRMKLNDDSIQRYHRECTIEPGKATALTVLEKCLTRVSGTVPVEGQPWNEVALKEALEAICVIYPSVVPTLQPFFDTAKLVEAADAALKFLQAEKLRLLNAEPEKAAPPAP